MNGKTAYLLAITLAILAVSPAPGQPDGTSLSDALDTILNVTTSGDAEWFAQTSTSHHEGDAAQSGDISDNQVSQMQVSTQGTGRIEFYWRVSSEEGYDFLEFYIDDELQDRISGETDWQKQTYEITAPRIHTLQWQYIKDSSVDSGSDCGWVDQLQWQSGTASGWRSSLYPEEWIPGDKDNQGRFLHDFSYAGYHKGEIPIPNNPPGIMVDVTHRPYGADNTGASDATGAIQRAINTVGMAGGGIVYLPPGTYRIKPPQGSDYALRIEDSGVVLRGADPDQTFLFNDEPYMRSKSVIYVRRGWNNWTKTVHGTEVEITRDVDSPAHIIPVARTSGFHVGDWIILYTDRTDSFIAEHNMTGKWNTGTTGIMFYRQITDVNPSSNTITVDIPTRYYLKTRDNARVFKVTPHLDEIGIEHLSIGMRENLTGGLGDSQYKTIGTAAYEVHGSHFIRFYHVVNGWIRNVQTYRPPVNTHDWHVLSNIIVLNQCRNVTICNCIIGKPEYEGGGGNGYGYTLRSNDCLIVDSTAFHTRHNYSFAHMHCSGNVIFRCAAVDGRLPSDFHMQLSPANLIDNMYVDGDYLHAVYRPYGTTNIHGHSTTESVFWNTYGTHRCGSRLIVSRQWKWGYIIGTSGPVHNIQLGTQDNTAPEDFVEGEGRGGTLVPQSLYLDQFHKRCGKDVIFCEGDELVNSSIIADN